MNIKSTFLLVLVFGLMFHLSAQVNVLHVNSATATAEKNGIYYSLPRTVIKVDVVVRAQEYLKGPFADYAEKYLGMDDVIKYDYTSYSIQNVWMSTSEEADPGQVYYAEMGNRESKELKNLTVMLDDAGFLLAANNLDDDLVGASAKDEAVVLVDASGNAFGDMEEFYIHKQINTKIDTIIRRATVDTALVEQRFFRTRVTNKTPEEMALQTLEKIEEVRDARMKLLTGFQEIPYDAGAIAYMDRNLLKMEQDYLDLFAGKSYAELKYYTFYYTPENESGKNAVALFKFSASSGLASVRGGSGENVELQIQSDGLASALAGFGNDASGDLNQKGFAYRIPGNAKVQISLDGMDLATEKFRVNQFGVVRRLPAQKFKAQFHNQTGGVQSITLN